MPNHVHGIVVILDDDTGRGDRPVAPTVAPTVNAATPGPAKRSLGAFVAGFKSIVTKRINAVRGTPGRPVWQRNYYEHIIRDQRDLERIRAYIANNPHGWALDAENPAHVKP